MKTIQVRQESAEKAFEAKVKEVGEIGIRDLIMQVEAIGGFCANNAASQLEDALGAAVAVLMDYNN